MNDLAWMKLWIGDELKIGTQLTPEEHGAFHRLRLHYWEYGGLPDDDKRRMRITGVDADRWEDVRSAIAHLFADGWRLEKLDEQLQEASTSREKTVTKAKAAAEARWGKRTPDATSNARSTATSNASSNARSMPDAMHGEMHEQCPSASASDEDLGLEGIAPTHAHARGNGLPQFTDKTFAETWLISQGVFPGDATALAEKAMAGTLTREDF